MYNVNVLPHHLLMLFFLGTGENLIHRMLRINPYRVSVFVNRFFVIKFSASNQKINSIGTILFVRSYRFL